MCGIAGMMYYDPERVVEERVLSGMTNTIVHRGPDDEGFYREKNVGLGFRRLSIIDVSLGHQPLCNAAGNLCIVFNGEIYNFQEQRSNLLKKGYRFKTQTDTEVILYLYEEYGVSCLQYLRGMFAFAIWDSRKQQLFCGRDRFGIKPFYYYQDSEKFVFGSEIKSIVKVEGIDTTLSPDAIDSYFAYSYITSDLSIYQHIKKLQPGHYMIVDLKRRAIGKAEQYWEIDFEPDYSKTEAQWSDLLQEALSETVKLHMISDVPLGAFLSGGIDSSSVVGMMTKHSNQPIKTFSIGFKEEKFNELGYARQMAEKYGCDHHELILEPDSINLLPRLVEAYDEPFSDSSAIPTYYVSKFAREYVTVALSGDGGDELFAGNDHYPHLYRNYRLTSPFTGMNRLLWGNVYKLLPQNFYGEGLSYYLSKNRNFLGAYSCLFREKERKRMFRSEGAVTPWGKASERFKEEILRSGKKNDFISNLQYLDLKTYMVDSVLVKVDRASMLNSLEVRVPILDHKFAELTFKIPWNLKFTGKSQKYIFKEAMRGMVPDSILNHPKRGFAMPLSHWFKGDLNGFIQDTLLSGSSHYSAYIDGKIVRKEVERIHSNGSGNTTRLWSLLFFELWLKQNKTQ